MDDEHGAPAAATRTPAVGAPAATAPLTAPAVSPMLDDAPPYAPPAESFRFATAPTTAASPAPVPVGPGAPVGALWAATALVVVVLTVFFGLIVSGRVVTEGPVLLTLTRTHGVHLGDVLALGLWCLAVGVQGWALTAAVRSRRRTTSGRATGRR